MHNIRAVGSIYSLVFVRHDVSEAHMIRNTLLCVGLPYILFKNVNDCVCVRSNIFGQLRFHQHVTLNVA